VCHVLFEWPLTGIGMTSKQQPPTLFLGPQGNHCTQV